MKRFIWLAAFACLGLLSFETGTAAENQQWEELFFRANQAYKDGRFAEAIEKYQRLLQAGHASGHLYYNMGNAYFRMNDLGRAILNFERALLLIPRDADLKFNNRYAHDQAKDAVAESPGFIGMTFFWLNSFNLDELFWGFAVFNILFWGSLMGRLFIRSEWIYYFSIILLAFWLITGASFGLKWYQLKTDDRAVILQPEQNVLAGPDIQDTALFKLHAGTLVHAERSEDGWTLIRLPDNKRGWVRTEKIGRILEESAVSAGSSQ